MQYILGIDIGTGSTKAVAVNLVNEVVDVSQHYYPTNAPLPGYGEQDPELIWDAFNTCINEIHSRLGAPMAVALSSAMHSLIAVDSHCSPLLPMMTWADSRCADIVRRTKGTTLGEELYNETGTPIHAMSPLFKIIWLRENEPKIFRETYKFISIKEYIWYRLFGEFKVDYSIASATGLFHILHLRWHQSALQLAQINELQLSNPVPTSYFRAGADLSGQVLPFCKDTSFVIGASDGCLANLGSYATEPGVAAITIGTSGAVRIASSRPIVNFKAMTFNYILKENTYICGGPINNGGNVLQWLLKNVFNWKDLNDTSYKALFDGLIAVKPGSDGLLFLPYLSGERAPIWDTKSCGVYFGLRNSHNQSHLAHAVLEGICFALNDVLTGLESMAGPISQINVSGGFVQSELWMQLLADITGKKIVRVQIEDASAIGAIQLAALALNIADYQRSVTGNEEVTLPNAERHQIYQKYFALFKRLYQQSNDTMHELHQLNQSISYV
ncbi:MAG: gluconokinase [Bacteroidota bacterium]